MRALRDFNLPKIVADDRGVFMGLIQDLFPQESLDLTRLDPNPNPNPNPHPNPLVGASKHAREQASYEPSCGRL